MHLCDHLQPQVQGVVFPILSTHLKTQFLSIPLFQQRAVETGIARQPFYILAIAVNVPCELGEYEVVNFERPETDVPEDSRMQFGQS